MPAEALREVRAWATDGIPMNHVPEALRALAEVTEAKSLEEWADFPSRTQQHVLDALDSAVSPIEGDPR